jgi:hypothetical protein
MDVDAMNSDEMAAARSDEQSDPAKRRKVRCTGSRGGGRGMCA